MIPVIRRPRLPSIIIILLAAPATAIVMNAKAAVPRMMRTFYRRELPSSCDALSSNEGRALFASAMAHGGIKSFFKLIEQFSTQIEPAFCGPSTLVVVLNALSVDPRRTWKGGWRWYEESMLNCCVDLEVVKTSGIDFGTFACLARCQGLTVVARRAEESSVAEFRRAVRASCVSEDVMGSSSSSLPPSSSLSDTLEGPVFLVTSYSRKVMGQTGDGHFSPVAAYDEVSDKVLILDTARFKYGPHWVPLQQLFDAMVPVDKDTGKSRGYFLLSFEGDDISSDHPLQSILFRSKKSQDPVRQEFKAFLESRDSKEPISFQEVESFWTKDGKDPRFIFDMIKPQIYPVDEEEVALIEGMGRLIRSLLDDIPRLDGDHAANACCGNKCGPNSFRMVPITAVEAIFVAYLASLPHERRRELVYGGEDASDSRFPGKVRGQLMREAELVQFAIDLSSCEAVD